MTEKRISPLTWLQGKFASLVHTHTTSDITDLSIPTASSSTPSADVTGGEIGSSSNYAKADHQHPLSTAYATNGHNHDSSYIAKASTDTGFVKSNGNIVAFGTTSGTVAEGNHTHSGYLTEMKIGSASGLPVKTTTNGVLTTGSFGTTSGTFAEGNHTHSQYLTEHQSLANYVTTSDSRLSDARTPTAHTHTTTDITNLSIPTASSTTPSADTTAGSYGSGTSYARSNHTHPKSTLYAEASHTHSAYVNPTICDNLTTNDATQVLSAKQGKVLNDLVGQAISYINQ